jgi:hypothetical protein
MAAFHITIRCSGMRYGHWPVGAEIAGYCAIGREGIGGLVTTLWAVLAGIAGAILGGIGAGFGAAAALTAAYGSREGSAAMDGFFTFGPVGAVIGTLAGVGLVLRYRGETPHVGNCILAVAGVALVIALGGLTWAAKPAWAPRPTVKYQMLEFELDVSQADWDARGGDKPLGWIYDENGDSRAPAQAFSGGLVENGRAYMRGYQQLEPFHPNPHLVVTMNGKTHAFPLKLPEETGVAADWCEWRTLEDMRLRYRVNLFP